MRADISSCMPTRHGEIHCSHPTIHGHGPRRKRCAICGKSWKLWPKKRGPKKRKRRTKRLERTFLHDFTLKQQAFLSGIPYGKVKKRQKAIILSLQRKPWPSIRLKGKLILLLDGIWFRICGKRWILYLLALRSTKSDTVRFLRPVIVQGNENREGWEAAIAAIPPRLQKRICALVSDGLRGLPALAEERGWVYQWCHFHLLGRMANVIGTKKKTLSWMKGRKKTDQYIRELITTGSEKRLTYLRKTLRSLSRDPECPGKIRGIIREVLRRQDALRTYLDHPELRLPNTSNVMESFNSQLRKLSSRSHGFRTGKSLSQWMTAYTYFHSTGTCRPKKPT